ncbi:glycosyl hydrolases family 18-domain-containing protein [Gaertneriomyces semiglobifer]|nr:glycosyl hydrolases family 18-domain-containing protein [Gaertneriomyces semiglobifer]
MSFAGTLVVVGLALAISATPVAAVIGCGNSVLAKPGDTCYAIRTAAGIVDEAVFQAINPGLDCANLGIGQSVCVEGCQSYHLVKSGEWCDKIREDNGITPAEWNTLNPGLNCASLLVGQPICLEACIKRATVPAGGNCWAIANDAQITTTDLQRLNGGLNCNNLQVGQKLCASGCAQYAKFGGALSSCWAVQDQYKLGSVDVLLAMNPGLICEAVQAGQRVCVKLGAPAGPLTWPPPVAPAAPITTKPAPITTSVTQIPTSSVNPITTPMTSTRTSKPQPTPTGPPRPTIPLPCTKKYQVVSGDGCDSIADKHKINRDDFRFMNPGLDCGLLSLGQEVCVGTRLTGCPQIYTAVAGDTCESLAANYGLTVPEFVAMNLGLNCASSLSGQPLCMGSKPAKCLQFATVQAGDTCYSIQMTAGINDEEWTSLNGFGPGPGPICGPNLQIGTRLCIRGPYTGCTGYALAEGGETCKTVAITLKQRLADFQKANTWLNCDARLTRGTRYCVGSRMAAGCQDFHSVAAGETCEAIAAASGITVDALRSANTGLECAGLREGQRLCLEPPPLACESEITLFGPVGSNTTCEAIASEHNVDLATFKRINNQVDCDLPVPMMVNVCIQLATASSPQNAQLLTESLKLVDMQDPEIARLVAQYQSDPSDANYSLLGLRLLKKFGTEASRGRLAELEKSDPFFSAMANSKRAQRTEYCRVFQTDASLQQCFCGTDSLLYCVAMLQSRIDVVLSDPANVQLVQSALSGAVKDTLTPAFFERAWKENGGNMLRRRGRNRYSSLNQTSSGVALDARQFGGAAGLCEGDGGILKAFQGLRALFKGRTEFVKWARDPGTGNPIPNDACLLMECCWPMYGSPAMGVMLGPCLSGGLCMADLDVKSVFGSKCTKEGCTFNKEAITDTTLSDAHIALAVKFCLTFDKKKVPIVDVPIIGHIIEEIRCVLELSLKIFLIRGDLEYVAKAQLGPLIVEIKGNTQMTPSQAPCPNPCAKTSCHAPVGSTVGELALKVDYFLGSTTFFTKELGELPECDPIEVKALALQAKAPNPMKGAVIGSYFPNWVAYHDDALLPRLLDQARYLTHIYVGFMTISYSIEFDSYYLDFSDPWGDLNMCRGLSPDDCHAYNGPEVDYESPGCMDIDVAQCSPGVVAVAPYLGYVKPGGGCPAAAGPDTCYNKAGVPGLRKVPCYTVLDGPYRMPKSSGRPKVCGQFQFLLQQVKAVNPDVRVIISVGGWYDSPYWSIATNDKYIDGFIESIGRWTDAMDFDGVDIDWEFPGFEHGGQPVYPAQSAPGNVEETTDCTKSQCTYPDRAQDGVRYVNLLRKLKDRLARSGPLKNGLTGNKVPFELSMAPPVGFDKVEKMRLREMCLYLDHINLMAYDLNGSWNKLTNHQAHFHDRLPGTSGPQYELEAAIKSFTDGGCGPDKLVLGVPFYGRAFKDVDPGPDPAKPGLYQPHGGNAYNEQGILSFGEISRNPAWKVFWDGDAKASAAYNAQDRTFVTFDTVEAVKYKIDEIKRRNMKGAMYWLMGQDDSQNTLLSTLAQGLRG